MNASVCTLFEGNYHYGVAALTNSLYSQGYRGIIYAGYKGNLPFWAANAEKQLHLGMLEYHILNAEKGLQIHFILLDTQYHLTNYKPDFMLQLWEGPAVASEALVYFDPDIVLIAPWDFIIEWLSSGVALCEDIKSPLERYHPRRMGWRNYYNKYGIHLSFKNAIYVNGGFIGVKKENKDFINKWKIIQQHMEKQIGSLNKSSISEHTKLPDNISIDFSPFSLTDQDALNATIEACNINISYMHQEAMALRVGTPVIIPHALGKPKPWNYNPIKSFIQGSPPRVVDKHFWKYVEYPIKCYPSRKVKRMHYIMKLISLLSRFYSRR